MAYQVYIDGACRGNPGPSGIGIVIIAPAGNISHKISEFLGNGTNNQAEYQALIRALLELSRNNIQQAKIFSDSELLVKQIKGQYRIKEPRLQQLFKQVLQLGKALSWEIQHLPREENREADRLANQAIDLKLDPPPPPPPPPSLQVTTSPQVSAGGVVYKKEGNQVKVCLVAKKGGTVWALPKGRLKEGETLPQAAQREILEETGFLTQVKEEITQINYHFYWKENNTLYHKKVHFFLMPLSSDIPQARDTEAEKVNWFTLGEAKKILTYLNEKDVLEKAAGLII